MTIAEHNAEVKARWHEILAAWRALFSATGVSGMATTNAMPKNSAWAECKAHWRGFWREYRPRPILWFCENWKALLFFPLFPVFAAMLVIMFVRAYREKGMMENALNHPALAFALAVFGLWGLAAALAAWAFFMVLPFALLA